MRQFLLLLFVGTLTISFPVFAAEKTDKRLTDIKEMQSRLVTLQRDMTDLQQRFDAEVARSQKAQEKFERNIDLLMGLLAVAWPNKNREDTQTTPAEDEQRTKEEAEEELLLKEVKQLLAEAKAEEPELNALLRAVEEYKRIQEDSGNPR